MVKTVRRSIIGQETGMKSYPFTYTLPDVATKPIQASTASVTIPIASVPIDKFTRILSLRYMAPVAGGTGAKMKFVLLDNSTHQFRQVVKDLTADIDMATAHATLTQVVYASGVDLTTQTIGDITSDHPLAPPYILGLVFSGANLPNTFKLIIDGDLRLFR